MRPAILIVLVLLAACEPAAVSPWSPCTLPGYGEVAECAQVDVPLDYDNPNRSQITVHAARVRARAARVPRPPLVILAGGPGQGAIDYGGWLGNVMRPTLRHRDVILIDQRGTGRSHALDCRLFEGFGAVSDAEIAETARRCAESLDIDATFFGTASVIRDLERIRRTLKLGRIALWGGSFGTRTALRYIARYPDNVDAAVLDGVTANVESLFNAAPKNSEASWRALVSRCQNDERCSDAYPNLDKNFEHLRLLPRTPATIVDPITGTKRSTTVDGSLISNVVRGALYAPTHRSLVPMALSKAMQGNFGPLAAIAAATDAWAGDTMSLGTTLTILCSEDVDRITSAAAKAAGEQQTFEHRYYRFWSTACTNWPRTKVPADYGKPVTAEVPTLVLSGALDPVTPPANGEVVAATMPNVTHLVAPFAGHGVTSFGCGAKLIARFLDAPGEPIDGDCLKQTPAPPFVIEGETIR